MKSLLEKARKSEEEHSRTHATPVEANWERELVQLETAYRTASENYLSILESARSGKPVALGKKKGTTAAVRKPRKKV